VEKEDYGCMSRPPQKAEKALFSKSSVTFTVVAGVYMAAVTLSVYAYALFNFGNGVATSMTFLTISFAELFHSFNIRSERLSAFCKGALSNKVLLATVAFGVAVNVALCCSPIAGAFGLCNLSLLQWLGVFLLSLSVIPFSEAYKFAVRKFTSGRKVAGRGGKTEARHKLKLALLGAGGTKRRREKEVLEQKFSKN
jgi:Ca2+-transporting ATPase